MVEERFVVVVFMAVFLSRVYSPPVCTSSAALRFARGRRCVFKQIDPTIRTSKAGFPQAQAAEESGRTDQASPAPSIAATMKSSTATLTCTLRIVIFLRTRVPKYDPAHPASAVTATSSSRRGEEIVR